MSSDPSPPIVYNPGVFDCATEAEARSVILTAPPDEIDARWRKETPATRSLVNRHLQLKPGQAVIDFGCGIGRVAREIIRFSKVEVTGIDISASMRQMARDYVGSDRFKAWSPADLDHAIAVGTTFDAAYSIYVLQHCLEPRIEINRLCRAVKPGGLILIINSLGRWVPTDRGWVDDGQDVRRMLDDSLTRVAEPALPETMFVDQAVPNETFCAVYRNPVRSAEIS